MSAYNDGWHDALAAVADGSVVVPTDDALTEHRGCCGHRRTTGCGGRDCPCGRSGEVPPMTAARVPREAVDSLLDHATAQTAALNRLGSGWTCAVRDDRDVTVWCSVACLTAQRHVEAA